METFCAPTVFAAATRAGDSPATSRLSPPATEKVSFMIVLTTGHKLTDCEVNSAAYAVIDSSIDCTTNGAAKGEVDNGGLARGDSMIHSSVDSTYDVGKGA